MDNVEKDDNVNLDFKWLKKRGVGGKNKESQFYESFIYDGVEYTLFDCVYMYKEGKEGLQEPYIGKLIKIWEVRNFKKVKVQWFFRPTEISKWLGNMKTLDKEIFFASGEGHGLANINPLESIAGPCNVVCVSKDCRNPQPSDEELKAADFVFYRTFSVQSCTILDRMDDKVGELEINKVFNRKKSETISSVPENASDKKEENLNITSVSEPQQLLTTVQDDPNLLKRSISPTESDKSNDRPSKIIKPDGKNLPEEKRAEPVAARDSEILTDIPLKKSKVENSNQMPVNANNLNDVGTFGPNSETGKINIANKDSMKTSIVLGDKLESSVRNKTPSGSDILLQNRPFKKRKFDFKTPLMETEVELEAMSSKKAIVDNESKHEDKLPAAVDNLIALGTSGSTKEKLSQRNGKVSSKDTDALERNTIKKTEVEPKLMSSKKSIVDKSNHEDKLLADVSNLKDLGTSGSAKEKLNQRNGDVALKVTDALEGNITKKTKDGCSQELPDNGRVRNATNGSSGEDLVASSASSKGILKVVVGLAAVSTNETHKEEKLAVNKLLKGSALSNDRDEKIRYQEFICGPKPNADKSDWFRRLPWDQRLKNAYDQGTALLLHNVDPDFSSADIEDIVWSAFNEKCEAKIVQHTAVSSPHYGQALILLDTKEAAQKILVRLDEECLISKGRPLVPLVATVCPPISTKRHSSFLGNLVLDKNRVQSQHEDEAVSTSHFSQPNTIEYEMAMEWCLLQSRSKKWWDKMHKQQGLELKNVESPCLQK